MAQYRVYLIKETMLVVGTQSEPDRALEYGQTVFQRKERAFQVWKRNPNNYFVSVWMMIDYEIIMADLSSFDPTTLSLPTCIDSSYLFLFFDLCLKDWRTSDGGHH